MMLVCLPFVLTALSSLIPQALYSLPPVSLSTPNRTQTADECPVLQIEKRGTDDEREHVRMTMIPSSALSQLVVFFSNALIK